MVVVSSSSSSSVHAILSEVEHQKQNLEQQLSAACAEMHCLMEEHTQVEQQRKSLHHYLQQHPSTPTEVQPPAKQHHSQPITNKGKALIHKKVYNTQEMSWKEAEEVYGIHHSSIAHIIQAAHAHNDHQQALVLHNPQPPAPTK
jgi:hypothetical protein